MAKSTIIKTFKYSVYPNGYVYAGSKLYRVLSSEEHEFLLSINGRAKKDLYIENPDDLKKAIESASNELSESIREHTIHEPIDLCDHSWRYSGLVNSSNGMLFYCIRCLKLLRKSESVPE